MNEQIWRTFKAVSEQKSLSKAARALNLSQSAVSQQIHQLESWYGTALLIRNSQGVTLNPIGEIVYRYVTQLLRTIEESRQVVRQLLAKLPTQLTIGASLTIAEYILPHALTRLDPHKYPDVTLYMANSHDVVDRVLNREIELGLIEAPATDTALVTRPFLEDRLKLVVGHPHPWSKHSEITLEQLCQVPLILREPGSGTRITLESALGQVGLSLSQLNIRFVLGTTQAIKAMISQGMGASVLSPYTILPNERHQFHTLDVQGLAFLRHFTIIHHYELAHPLAEALIRTLFHHNWPQILNDPK